ncbi:hypothetical protein [Nitrosococcus watsonii]|uniref:Uncharacterized protein n=1 Tax=Nitrosococcus watsoni (strain C-113) TaxID=105559 RepID=D8K7K6_NITWC|nr:hypothetical protein [Nitrosococcus watsonii]ADJ28883.1 conserved hypothetical protein [Nitrosococcus watsonii C-113]
MARVKKSPEMENTQAENPVTMLEVKFATVRQKLPAEYEKAITGAGRVLASRIKKLDTLNGRLAKARERLTKAREQQKIKATAAVQTRFEKARLAVAELKVESADLRAEIAVLRKEISDLKKRSRQFQTIEKAIQKLEKKAATPHKPRRRKKTKATARKKDLESQWEQFTGGSSSNKESAFAGREVEAEVE